MKHFVLLCSFVVLFSLIAKADSKNIAENLGALIGSEKYCGLSYNQEEILNYIKKHIKSDDKEFLKKLDFQTMAAEGGNSERSASSKTVHCFQIKRLAKSLKFIE